MHFVGRTKTHRFGSRRSFVPAAAIVVSNGITSTKRLFNAAIQRLFRDPELIPAVTTETGWPLPSVVGGLSTLHFESGRRLFGPQNGD